MILFNGQIITAKKDGDDNEIIKFEQLNIDLSDLSNTTIKEPKLQETSTIMLVNCFINNSYNNKICKEDYKKEILATLSRRFVIPFYIPIVSLFCSMLLIKTDRAYLNKVNLKMI